MEKLDKGQVNRNAAEIYEEFFIPALFQEWAGRVADVAHIQTGQRVLDVACGTGILARTVSNRVGINGSVVGLDINEGMLAVAAKKAPAVEWRQGKAEALPFENNSFDAVVSQFGLMFFEDRQAAIREMFRVLKSGGHLAVAVWDSLDNTPGYAAVVKLLQRLFGEQTANAIRAPFILGDVEELRSLFRDAGIPDVQITTIAGTARFPSIEAWVYTDIKGWVLADMLDDEQFALLLGEARQTLASFVTADGSVAFSAPAHIISAVKA
jgi:ubiquinone/menaquinone biosynthesis C-methylase UbiE